MMKVVVDHLNISKRLKSLPTGDIFIVPKFNAKDENCS